MKTGNSIQDLKVISSLITLPKNPVSIRWELNENIQPDLSSLVVLMEFEESDLKEIVGASNKFEVTNDEIFDPKFFNDWILNIIEKENISYEKRGEYIVLIGVHAMEPNLFTNALHSPFIHGRLIPLTKRKVLLSLHTM